jgi:hypothetical protein
MPTASPVKRTYPRIAAGFNNKLPFDLLKSE